MCGPAPLPNGQSVSYLSLGPNGKVLVFGCSTSRAGTRRRQTIQANERRRTVAVTGGGDMLRFRVSRTFLGGAMFDATKLNHNGRYFFLVVTTFLFTSGCSELKPHEPLEKPQTSIGTPLRYEY